MPYTLKGKSVYKKANGLKKVGSSKTARKAKRYIKTLRAIHSGWRPTRNR